MSGRSFVVDKLETAESNDSAPGSYTRRNVRISWAPLDEMSMDRGTVRCPWHGYVFDVRTGECVSGEVTADWARAACFGVRGACRAPLALA